MDDRTNTIAGWALAGGVVALGMSIVSGMYFKSERPERMGYAIEGVAEESEGGAALAPIATRLASADLAAGEQSFRKCVACHTINQGGASTTGPNLWGVAGARHGHVAGFGYSDALTSKPGNWTFEALDEWLTSPRRYAPGTKMTFAGLPDPQERANLIAYLNTQGSNLPLPAPPAPETTAPGNETGTGNVSNEAGIAPGAPSQDPAAREH